MDCCSCAPWRTPRRGGPQLRAGRPQQPLRRRCRPRAALCPRSEERQQGCERWARVSVCSSQTRAATPPGCSCGGYLSVWYPPQPRCLPPCRSLLSLPGTHTSASVLFTSSPAFRHCCTRRRSAAAEAANSDGPCTARTPRGSVRHSVHTCVRHALAFSAPRGRAAWPLVGEGTTGAKVGSAPPAVESPNTLRAARKQVWLVATGSVGARGNAKGCACEQRVRKAAKELPFEGSRSATLAAALQTPSPDDGARQRSGLPLEQSVARQRPAGAADKQHAPQASGGGGTALGPDRPGRGCGHTRPGGTGELCDTPCVAQDERSGTASGGCWQEQERLTPVCCLLLASPHRSTDARSSTLLLWATAWRWRACCWTGEPTRRRQTWCVHPFCALRHRHSRTAPALPPALSASCLYEARRTALELARALRSQSCNP